MNEKAENQLIQCASSIQRYLEYIDNSEYSSLRIYQDTRIFNDRQEAFEFYKAFISNINNNRSLEVYVYLAANKEILRGDEIIIQQSIDIYLQNISCKNKDFTQVFSTTILKILNTLDSCDRRLNRSPNNTTINDFPGNSPTSGRNKNNILLRVIKSKSFGSLFPIAGFSLVILFFGVLVLTGRMQPSSNSPGSYSSPAPSNLPTPAITPPVSTPIKEAINKEKILKNSSQSQKTKEGR
jgi:hypothetical protein